MAVAFQGYLFGNLRWFTRIAFLITGLFLIHPYWMSDLMGYLLLLVILLLHITAVRASRVPS
jgi:TRAP-type uncharacterized transport system fused permease subunit